jgi:GTP-binding protein LepA
MRGPESYPLLDNNAQHPLEYIGTGRVLLGYSLPLNEIVPDFYDRLKSASRGYASLDYHLAGYQVSPMVRLDVLVAGDPVDALSMIIHRDRAYDCGKALIERLRKLIPRQMFEVALQAAIGSKIVARETSRPCARTCWPSATAATSRASASCWRSKKKASAA